MAKIPVLYETFLMRFFRYLKLDSVARSLRRLH